MALTDRSVVVVGSAIGGATAALLLARAGARVTVLERVPNPRGVGAGIALQPNGLAVLYGLGLADRLQAAGTALRSLAIRDRRGQALATGGMPDYGHGLDHVLMIRRGDLHAALLEAVRAEPNIQAEFGAEVLRVARTGQVTYRTGDGQETTLTAELVIGADGVHSVVCQQGDFGARVKQTGYAVRGLSPVRVAAEAAGEGWPRMGLIGLLPLPAGTYFFTATNDRAEAEVLARHDLAAYQALWARIYPPSAPILAAVERFDDLLINAVIRVDCARWVDGRLALIGDAAHAMAPNVGQGANSALVDAVVLVHELRGADDQAVALSRYERRRQPAVRKVQDKADRMAWLAALPGPGRRWLRDRLISRLSRLPGFTGRTAHGLMQENPAWLLASVEGLGRGASSVPQPVDNRAQV